MAEYKKILDQAIAEEGAKHWSAARKLYAQAGQCLLQESHRMSPNERMTAIRSVEIMRQLAEEMKNREEKEAAECSRIKTSAENDEQAGTFYPAEKPNIRFEDIAGLTDVKELILEEIIQPRKYPELYKRFLQNTNGGILLYGPPGTGKTMLAQAIASEIDADFYSIRCSDIVGKYFGESERRLKALFETARRSGNAIIFFDEFEALGSKRGGNSTVMNRLVPELLSQINGFEKGDGRLIVIAATNRPWDLDPAFLRPTRLTHHVYVPLPDLETREALLRKWIEQVPHADDIDFTAIAKQTEGMNCADVVHVFNMATRGPIRRTIDENDETHQVTSEDLYKALRLVMPSVNRGDLASFDKWMAQRRGA